MPRPKPQKQTIDIPLTSGLSEKEIEWQLPQGHAHTITNFTKNKQSAIGKPLGFTPLTTGLLSQVKQLATRGSTLLAVGPDGSNNYADALWSYSENRGAATILDRVAEAYMPPVRSVASYNAESPVYAMDTLVTAKYELHVWLVDETLAINAKNKGYTHYAVVDRTTGAYVVTPQIVPGLGVAAQLSPKLVLCGTTAVLVYWQANDLIGVSLDMTAPWSNWPGPITLTAADVFGFDGVYDVCAVDDDATSFVVIYQGGSRLAPAIQLRSYHVSAFVQTANGQYTDATWNADTNPNISGFAIRASVADGGAFFAYGWQIAAGPPVTSRARAGAQQFPALGGGVLCTPVDLANGFQNFPQPTMLAIARVGTISATPLNHHVVWSGQAAGFGFDTNYNSANQSPAAAIFNSIWWVSGGAGALQLNQPRWTNGVLLASRLAVVQAYSAGVTTGRAYVMGWIPSSTSLGSVVVPLQGSCYLFSLDTFADVTTHQDAPSNVNGVNQPMRWVASVKPRLVQNFMLLNTQVLPHLVGVGSLWQTIAPVNQTPQIAAPTVAQFDFGSSQQYATCELGGLTALASGVPMLTDGARAFEYSFPYYPEQIPTPSFGAGANTYQYIVTYECRDFAGNVHRSGRSTPVTAANAAAIDGGHAVILTIPTLGFSNHSKPTNTTNLSGLPDQPLVTIEVYRTTPGGIIFYNIGSQTFNSLSRAYVTVNDTTTDGVLTANAQLYGDGSNGATQGSIVNNLTPPAFQHQCVHKNRIFGVDGANIWFTKALTTGEGPGFNELFAFSVDDGAYPVTAIVPMDERLIIFKRDRIFYLVGDGPTDNNASNDLQPPQRIQSDVGCINWRSVVSSPVGIWFQSDNGLYLLTRKLEVQPTGKFVEDTLAIYSNITSATLDMQNGVIVWTANSKGGQGLVAVGVMIVYSWVLDCWTVQQVQYPQGTLPLLNASVLSNPTGATTGPETLAIGTANGGILRQNATTAAGAYMTNGLYQGGVWEGPWIHGPSIADFSHFSKAFVQWQNQDPHQFFIDLAYNNSDNYTDSFSISATSQSAVTTPQVEWEVQPSNPRAQSMRIRLRDVQDGTKPPVTGQGPIVFAVTVEVGTKGGTMRIPVAQRGSA